MLLRLLVYFSGQFGDGAEHLSYQAYQDNKQDGNKNKNRGQCAHGAVISHIVAVFGQLSNGDFPARLGRLDQYAVCFAVDAERVQPFAQIPWKRQGIVSSLAAQVLNENGRVVIVVVEADSILRNRRWNVLPGRQRRNLIQDVILQLVSPDKRGNKRKCARGDSDDRDGKKTIGRAHV